MSRQVTCYLSGDADLRIQKGDNSAKIWLKAGKIHQRGREEIEVEINRENFDDAIKLFEALGYGVKVKWYRKRHKFKWRGLEVCVDHTAGYGRIVEVEKMCEEGEKEEASREVEEALEKLDVEKTPEDTFDEKFQNYMENWREILEERNLEDFHPS